MREHAGPPLPHASSAASNLWISPVDERGGAVDPAFLEAAERIGGGFFLYRAREMNDPRARPRTR